MNVQAVAAKEIGLICAADPVRAILDGRKTQTRRIIKPPPQPISATWGDIEESETYPGEWFQWCDGGDKGPSFTCPYGAVGDRLWVREKWGYHPGSSDSEHLVVYAATPKVPGWEPRRGPVEDFVLWRSPIHMPRWASRLTLEITDLKVEELCAISWRDCIAEGVIAPDGPFGPNYIDAFSILWDRINGKRAPWASNPWVWVISFRRLT